MPQLRMKTGVVPLLLLLLENSLSSSVPCSPCECYVQAEELYAQCSRRNLAAVPDSIPPNVTHLFLNRNQIRINSTSFERFKDLLTLNLASNLITTLPVDAFIHNRKLKTLNLYKNMLNTKSFPKSLFRSQKAIESLNIAMNKLSEYPDIALSDLTSLSSLVVDGLPTPVFGRGFGNLKLRNLDMSGKEHRCPTKHLTNNSFIYLQHLFYLDVSKCVLIQIDAGAFLPLRFIDTLDMSNNKYLGYNVFGQSFYGLINSSIRVVKADRIVSEFSIGQILNVSHVGYFLNTSMTQFSFGFNRLEIVDSNVAQYLSKLDTLSVKGNRFVFGPYLLAGDRLTNIKRLDASYQYEGTPFHIYRQNSFKTTKKRSIVVKGEDRGHIQGSVLKEEFYTGNKQVRSQVKTISEYAKENGLFDRSETMQRFQITDNPKIRFPFPKHLEIMNISHSKLPYTIPEIIFYNNTLKIVDASHNHFTQWGGPVTSITGHMQLEYVDLSNNLCNTMNSTFFHSTPYLRTLDISNNYLSGDLSSDVEGLIFRHTKLLRTLRISNNNLQELPNALFSELQELQHLDLNSNSLSTWTVAIGHMIHLQHLDISFNRFFEIPQTLRADIDNIMKNTQSLRISIKGNSLRCDCKTIDSLQWMLDSKVVFPELNVTSCLQEDMSIVNLGDLRNLVSRLQLRCNTSASLVVGLSLGVFVCLFLSVAGVLYRYRWKLRYLYYTAKRRHRGYERLDQEQDNFTYDAFISYSDEDRRFVIDDMRVILEDRYGLKLCIHHRDFMVGQAITDNIINAIQTSRRTVVVLSPYFVKSSWCLYEVHMARLEGVYTGRDVMCVVWYRDPPSTRDLSSDLLEELATGTYLKYNEEEQEMFWQSLRDALTNNPYN